MSNNGILYLNIGFDCHNYSNWVNIDHNSIAVSGRMALPRRASKEDCVNYDKQVTGNNATEAEY